MSQPKFLTCRISGKHCFNCQEVIAVGDSIWPATDGYLHVTCAEQQAAGRGVELQPPPCKHWLQRGYCLMKERCFYSHPADGGPAGLEAPPQAAAIRAAMGPQAGPAGGRRGPSNEEAARRSRGPGRRNRVRNHWRASVFRSWLLDTFGHEQLSRGSGVLDVGGGKGELAFELLTLNSLPATVLDPRPLRLEGYVRRLQAGVYHSSRVFQLHNTSRSPLAALDVEDPDPGDLRHSDSGFQADGAPRQPGHLRMFLTEEIVVSVGRLSALRREGLEGGSGWVAAMAESSRLVLASRNEALEVAWTHKGLMVLDEHEPKALQQQQPVGRRWRRRRGDNDQDEVFDRGEPQGGVGTGCTAEEEGRASACGPMAAGDADVQAVVVEGFAALQVVPPPPPLVHGVAAEDGGGRAAGLESAPEPEPEPASERTRQPNQAQEREPGRQDCSGSSSSASQPGSPADIGPETAAGVKAAIAEAAAAPAAAPAAAAGAASGAAPAAAAGAAGVAGPAADTGSEDLLGWAEGAVRCLLDCSVVVGMHPDQAAGHAARLALALGRPFALVPCCVYAGEFPQRHLRSGQQVRTYQQLLRYLTELDPDPGRVVAKELPFEGKNVLLYRL